MGTIMNKARQTKLVASAQAARRRAYAPYSNFPVGAAVLTASGQVFEGANVENASYPATVCAERSAVFSAVSAGERVFEAIAVVTRGAGSPCGICRQVLSEFGTDTIVIIADENGAVRDVTTVAALLPDSFGPADLKSET